MHSTKRFLLKRGLGLTCVTNTQCKTSCLSAMFQLPLNSEGRSLSALLPYVLRVSCRDFPGQQAVAAQLDELYGARVEPIIRKRGEAQLIGFAADVIDEHFAMRGDTDLFANTAQMMARILLHPGEFTAETSRGKRHSCVHALRRCRMTNGHGRFAGCISTCVTKKPFGW